jgi:hypothetical protein
MSRRVVLGSALAVVAIVEGGQARALENQPDATKEVEARKRFIGAYPKWFDRVDERGLVWRDGTISPWDDNIQNKPFEQKLASASLADKVSLAYQAGPNSGPPPVNWDPGRFRNMPFFMKMYGGSEAAVRENLAAVPWRIGSYRESLPFTRINRVHEIVARIVEELAALPDKFAKFLVPPAGSFDWRPIAGTNGLSLHSFGIAIDINVEYSNYWRWDDSVTWRNRIPFEIVDVFERSGFIWGGKWYHYDTMHFEYRPELTIPD